MLIEACWVQHGQDTLWSSAMHSAAYHMQLHAFLTEIAYCSNISQIIPHIYFISLRTQRSVSEGSAGEAMICASENSHSPEAVIPEQRQVSASYCALQTNTF